MGPRAAILCDNALLERDVKDRAACNTTNAARTSSVRAINGAAFVLLVLLGCLVQGDGAAEEPSGAQGPHYDELDIAALAERMAATARPVSKLSGARFAFDDPERRKWDFWPSKYPGARVDRVSTEARGAIDELLRIGLSEAGSGSIGLIQALEPYNPYRSPYYSLAVFGEPGEAWGWRYQGHHMSLNFTLDGERVVSATPMFLGTQPLSKREIADGAAPLGDQENLARGLYASLAYDQRREATVDRPGATYLPLRTPRAERLRPEGSLAGSFNEDQRGKLIGLIRAYLDQVAPAIAEQEWAEIEAAGIDRIGFAWAGAERRGRNHYYRVQGPTFIIEYDSRDSGSHIHCVWRSFDGDFGDDLLARHVALAH